MDAKPFHNQCDVEIKAQIDTNKKFYSNLRKLMSNVGKYDRFYLIFQTDTFFNTISSGYRLKIREEISFGIIKPYVFNGNNEQKADDFPEEFYTSCIEDMYATPTSMQKDMQNCNRKKELITYKRQYMENTKFNSCAGTVCQLSQEHNLMEKSLKTSLGEKCIIKKTRKLFSYDQIHINVDYIPDVGSFVELHVILTKDQPREDGKQIIERIMKKLEIKKEDLIDCDYIDMLL